MQPGFGLLVLGMRTVHLPVICFAALAAPFFLQAASWAQGTRELEPIEVQGRPYGEQLVGPYHQPRWSARGRFSADTDVYVLPPYAFYSDVDYHGTFPRQGKPDHLFIQEFEIGLPHRFQVAFELYEERQDGNTQLPFTLIEGRYALADWGKIPLNPTFLAEYRFGIGKTYPVEPGLNRRVSAADDAEVGSIGAKVRSATKRSIPDGYELRLLLGQEIGTYVEFAGNAFYDQDIGADREREMGFSTAASFAIRGETLKVGVETSYRNVTEHGSRSHAQNICELGPSLTFKPTAHTRFDVAPLVGVTRDSPRLELFAIFSIDFGIAPEMEVQAPAAHGRY